MYKRTLGRAAAIGIASAAIPTVANAAPTTISFNLAGAGYGQDTPVATTLFAAQGVILGGELGLITACGGGCLSDGSNLYSGAIYGSFLSDVFSVSFDGALNDGTLYLYGADNALLTSIAGNTSDWSVPLTYQSDVAISSFKYDLNYEGLFALTFDTAPAVSAVPEPGTWAMMLLGFGGIGTAMRRKKKVAVPALA